MQECSGLCFKVGIDPIAATIGTYPLYWYGLLVAIGFVLAIRLASRLAEGRDLDPDQVLSAALVAALFGLLFARVYYVLQNQPGAYVDLKQLGTALSLWQGGLAFFGGIFGGVLGIWLYSARFRLPTMTYLDIGAVCAPLGQAVGRLGNLINGDLEGYPTSNFGVEYTNTKSVLLAPGAAGHPQHPVALYDSLLELALFVILYYMWRGRRLRTGQYAGVYLAGFAAIQLVVNAFRAAPSGAFGMKVAQLTALPVLAAGVWLLLRSRRGPEAIPA